MNLEKIRRHVLAGKSIEDVVEGFNWQEFERMVAEIFVKNDFKVKQNFRFNTKRRHEIDIIAVKNGVGLCVDCKEWSGGRHKKAALARAAEKQEDRIKELARFLEKNLATRNFPEMRECNFFPMIVTWFEEDMIKTGDVFVVPVWKLNHFLVNLERYI